MLLSTMPKTTTTRLHSVVRGYHVYMYQWDRVVGNKLNAKIEENNLHNQSAVAVNVVCEGKGKVEGEEHCVAADRLVWLADSSAHCGLSLRGLRQDTLSLSVDSGT